MFTPKLSERPGESEVRAAMLEAADHLVGLQTVARDKRDANWERDVRSAVDFVHAWDPIISAWERGLAGGAGAAPEAGTALLGNVGRRSAGDLFVSEERYGDFAGRHVSGATFFEHELRGSLFVDNPFEYRALDTDAANGGVFQPVGTPSAQPIRIRQARLFVRDVIAVQGTNLPSVPYIREVNATTNETGASSVMEGAAKPEVVMEFEQDDAPIRKIAAWIPATTEIIDDAPTLRGYIDTRLAYMLALREEQQVLKGSGAAPQLKGIMNYSGIQTQSFSTDVAMTVGLSFGKIENVDGEVDGVVMNPVKYWTMLTTRSANQFDGGFGAGAPFGAPAQGLWGVPVIRSRSLSLNECLVGAWRLGATLFDRMSTTIRVGNQHSDYFTTNRVAILAEERVGLAVHRPDFFVSATLG